MSGVRKVPINRNLSVAEMDDMADEVLIRIITTDNKLLANMLATPMDLEDLVRGHVLSEGLGVIESVKIKGHEIVIEGEFRERKLLSTSSPSCGACSSEDASQIFAVDENPRHIAFTWDKIHAGMERMRSEQVLFNKTGGTHAAALLSEQDFVLKEDVGRHNAVDKVVGATDNHSNYALLLSSRGGVELIAKACRVGIGLVACQGAASSAAADFVRSSGMTLIAFCRDGEGVVIGDNSRIIGGND